MKCSANQTSFWCVIYHDHIRRPKPYVRHIHRLYICCFSLLSPLVVIQATMKSIHWAFLSCHNWVLFRHVRIMNREESWEAMMSWLHCSIFFHFNIHIAVDRFVLLEMRLGSCWFWCLWRWTVLQCIVIAAWSVAVGICRFFNFIFFE